MGHSQSDKLRTHERILDVAAKRFRERGIEGISTSEIVKEVGITVGGFYKHFSSREALGRRGGVRGVRRHSRLE